MAKILLVDDSKMLLKHIKGVLMNHGHEVIATTSGRLAVAYIAAVPLDVVLTDLYMPPPDGFDIVEATKRLPKPPPVIVMSSNALAYGVFRESRALGAVATLHKPFTATQLLDTIRNTLAGVVPDERPAELASSAAPTPSLVATPS